MIDSSELVKEAMSRVKSPMEVSGITNIGDIPDLTLEEAKEPFNPPKITTDKIVDLDKDFNASAARLVELKRGRSDDEILLTDEYWIALKNHNKYFGVNK